MAPPLWNAAFEKNEYGLDQKVAPHHGSVAEVRADVDRIEMQERAHRERRDDAGDTTEALCSWDEYVALQPVRDDPVPASAPELRKRPRHPRIIVQRTPAMSERASDQASYPIDCGGAESDESRTQEERGLREMRQAQDESEHEKQGAEDQKDDTVVGRRLRPRIDEEDGTQEAKTNRVLRAHHLDRAKYTEHHHEAENGSDDTAGRNEDRSYEADGSREHAANPHPSRAARARE